MSPAALDVNNEMFLLQLWTVYTSLLPNALGQASFSADFGMWPFLFKRKQKHLSPAPQSSTWISPSQP